MNTGLKIVFVALVLACCPGRGVAQGSDSLKGTVEIRQDPKVDLLVSKHIRINENKKGIAGFRIQIFSDSGGPARGMAQGVYDAFVTKYPGIGAYLQYKSPNYKVRIGDYRTRLEAQRVLNELVVEYPNAFIITDQISLPNVE
jgi:hypothetical protein